MHLLARVSYVHEENSEVGNERKHGLGSFQMGQELTTIVLDPVQPVSEHHRIAAGAVSYLGIVRKDHNSSTR